MKQLLNTLYITSPDSYLKRDGNNIVVSIGGEDAGRIPIHNIQQVICFGRPGASPAAIELCVENDVTLTFMKPNGRFVASVSGPTRGNVLLRRSQYRMADDAEIANDIARNIITAKLINCRTVLKKGLNNHPELKKAGEMIEAIAQINNHLGSIGNCHCNGSIRGIEGDCAKRYFAALDNLILKDKENFFIHARTRRPPRDRVNAMLSFTYALLSNDIKHSLESVGLDPYVGFLHTDRPGRPSLALDMMEEMRPLADRFVLRLINLSMIQYDDFTEEYGGAFRIEDDARATVIDEWQKLKTKKVNHPYLGEDVALGLIPFIQSKLLSKYLRGDIDGYPPYIMRR